ncbi:TetR/AcrR family transcriptional regulator [Sulfurimonas sp. HSL-1716]|uniref:TetR/AcrR family transcriptional regulator n=1 Tax=Hydrocurvibacter sulfurireducens TaxID=3131937 RepID=UPI0031F9DD90
MSKSQRNAISTKAKIIENSMILFSKNGFDATTVDEIANESEVNKALLYYYFKNKSILYETVMNEVLSSIYAQIIEANKLCTNPVSELEAFIKTYADFADKQPYFPALLLRELSDNGAHLPEKMFSSMRRLFKLLSAILKKGEEEGVFQNVVPMVIHFMIIGTINLLVTTAPLRKKAALINEEIDTCSDCSIDEISNYIFEKIKGILEVKE